MQQDGDLYFLHADHLGATNLVSTWSTNLYSRQTYYPYGQVRTSEGNTSPTDYGFTGQKLDEATDLMYYGARYYDPVLARFVQADTVVPQAGNPQALNRYSYVYNNPLRYKDPSGHCPAPQLDPMDEGSVICVDLFIGTETILDGQGLGDNRTFSSNSDPAKSRGYAYIFLNKEGKLLRSELHLNPSCLAVGHCESPIWDQAYNNIEVTQDSGGVITVRWKLTNAFSALFLQTQKNAEREMNVWRSCNGSWLCVLLTARGPTGNADAALAALVWGIGGNYIPSIDGELKLGRGAGGIYSEIYKSRDPYPSLEVYQYSNNGVHTLDRTPERVDLGPINGLSDDAPRDRFGDR